MFTYNLQGDVAITATIMRLIKVLGEVTNKSPKQRQRQQERTSYKYTILSVYPRPLQCPVIGQRIPDWLRDLIPDWLRGLIVIL